MHARAIDLPGGTFHYLEWGAAGAPLILCLHGFPDHPHSFGPAAEILASRGHRVVAPWMRGYFPSVLEGPYHPDRLASDVLELAEALAGSAPVALVGHDWGAVATYAALAAAPERFRCGVTISVPHPIAFVRGLRRPAQLRRSWYMMFFQSPALPEAAVPRNGFALIDRLWRDWSPGYRQDGAARDRLHRCLAASMPAPIEYYRDVRRPLGAALARLRGWPAIRVPTLYLHGADDGCIGPEVGAGQERYFAGPFDSVVIAGAGHFLPLEQPDALAVHVGAWLAKHG